MIKSMTGFGRGSSSKQGIGTFVVEVQSVNKKHREINLHMPKEMLPFENRIRKVLADNIERGRVNLYVDFTSGRNKKVIFDYQLANDFLKQCKRMKKQLRLEAEIDMTNILSIPNIMKVEESRVANAKLWAAFEPALKKAIKDIVAMRRKEGINIGKDIKKRITFLNTTVNKIAKRAPLITKKYEKKIRDKFKERKELMNNKELMAKEVAVLAEKADITEEICRIGSHIKQIKTFLSKSGSIGRSLDFILQELMREINTISSKAGDMDVANHVIFFKSELEKIREQVQNIE